MHLVTDIFSDDGSGVLGMGQMDLEDGFDVPIVLGALVRHTPGVHPVALQVGLGLSGNHERRFADKKNPRIMSKNIYKKISNIFLLPGIPKASDSFHELEQCLCCLLYTSPSPRDS